MFKVREYKDVLEYCKSTAIQTIAILMILSIGFTKTNFTISLVSLYLLATYTLVKLLALAQAVDITEEKNTKFSWLTRVRYSVQ